MSFNLSDIIQIVELVIIVGAAIIALRTLYENAKLRRVEALGRVFEYYSSDEVRKSRKLIRDNPLPQQFEELNDEQRDAIELVLLCLSQIGFFIRLNTFSKNEKEILFRTYGGSILSVADVAQKYIKYYREGTGRSTAWENVDFIIGEVKKWREH
jgi:hypothetical protein